MLNRVTDRYFETAGIAIVAGRSFNSGDTLSSLKVAVVNQSLARRFFPKGDALGRLLTIDSDNVKGPWRIVGIARDTKAGGPRETKAPPMTYFPLAQMGPFNDPDPAAAGVPPEENQDRFESTILLRTTGDPAQAIGELRSTVAGIDPNLPILHVHTIHEEVDSFMTHDQLISRLTAIFSLLALTLAAIGLYGVMSYSVVRRTSEIGIRLALGAQSATVLWMVLRESLTLLAIGLALGLPLTLATTRVIREQLFGLSAVDPATFAAAIAVVAAMTIIAAWLPARRAAKVDPMVALRCD
jgi:predicted permease